jgi:hypothetical protein
MDDLDEPMTVDLAHDRTDRIDRHARDHWQQERRALGMQDQHSQRVSLLLSQDERQWSAGYGRVMAGTRSMEGTIIVRPMGPVHIGS